jgi:hypothetical protein
MDRRALEQHLGTLGPRADLGLALDATITPDTLLVSDARGSAGAAASSPAPASPAPSSPGPLPRIALSGLAPRSSSPPAGAASAPSPPESADLEVIGVLGEGGMPTGDPFDAARWVLRRSAGRARSRPWPRSLPRGTRGAARA